MNNHVPKFENFINENVTYSSSEMNSNIGIVWTKYVKGPANMGIYSDVYNWLRTIDSSGNYTEREINTVMQAITMAMDRFKKNRK